MRRAAGVWAKVYIARVAVLIFAGAEVIAAEASAADGTAAGQMNESEGELTQGQEVNRTVEECPSPGGNRGIVIGRFLKSPLETQEKLIRQKLENTPLASWEFDDVLRSYIGLSAPELIKQDPQSADTIDEIIVIANDPELSQDQKVCEMSRRLDTLREKLRK